MTNVILVVDTLKGFLDKDAGLLANPDARKVIPNIRDLLERKTKEGWKVIFLADNHKENDLEFEMFPKHCVIGTEETQIVMELEEFVGEDNYISKTRYSGLFRTTLEKVLQKENAEKIVVVGIYADICVLYTAADLRNRDYDVTVAKDSTMTLTGIDAMIFEHMQNILGIRVVERQEEI